jgi:hypothetical protein
MMEEIYEFVVRVFCHSFPTRLTQEGFFEREEHRRGGIAHLKELKEYCSILDLLLQKRSGKNENELICFSSKTTRT